MKSTKESVYFKSLSVIKNIKFTLREIDVLACIIHNRGEKKIAAILGISHRTVGTHVHNIMIKIGVNSRDSLIDFIQNAGKISCIRKYYLKLILEDSFKKQLSKIKNNELFTLNTSTSISKNVYVKLKEHFKIINIEVTQDPQRPIDIDGISLENYYSNFFNLLKGIFGKKIDVLEADFEKDQNMIIENFDSTADNSKIRVLNPVFLVSALVVTLSLISAYFLSEKENIRADIQLPHDTVLLSRDDIIQKIQKIFSDKNGINTVVLVGAGGAGKTTIARKYARVHDGSLIWEINAESKETIMSAFEALAYTLYHDNESIKEEIKTILQTKDQTERSKRLLVLITKKIKDHKNWLIIYNNLKTFQDIQKYFSYDHLVWGKGNVLITTRDNNINMNNYIAPNNIIHINELSKSEKLELFGKILNTQITDLEAENFLDKIPSFPLDISLAAYYIKEENVNYEDYLKFISEPQRKDFLSIQQTILKDIGDYTKTRFEIVTLSLRNILENKPELKDLMSIISLIDHHNISRSFLSRFADESTISIFLREMKKFSLINKISENNFSVHESTQKIMQKYFAYSQEQIKAFGDILNQIVREKKDDAVEHANEFISHEYVNEEIKAMLSFSLGIHYFRKGDYAKSENLLKKSFNFYNRNYGSNHIKTAEIASRLGSLYRNLEDYKSSISYLEQALIVYLDKYGKDHIKTATIYTYLGAVYRHVGDYDKALEFLNHSLKIHTEVYGADHIKTLWTNAYIGNVYNNLGNYLEAKTLLEKSYQGYVKYYGPNNTKTAWIYARLGNVYSAIGSHKQAQEIFSKALKIYKEKYGENCIEVAWVSCHMGHVYATLGKNSEAKEMSQVCLSIHSEHYAENAAVMGWTFFTLGKILDTFGEYEKANKYFNYALKTYKIHYGENHIQTASVLKEMAKMHIAKQELDDAEILLLKAIKIVEMYPVSFAFFDSISDLYIKKSTQMYNDGNLVEAKRFKDISIKYLKLCMQNAKNVLPQDSKLMKSMLQKLNNLES